MSPYTGNRVLSEHSDSDTAAAFFGAHPMAPPARGIRPPTGPLQPTAPDATAVRLLMAGCTLAVVAISIALLALDSRSF